MRTRKGNDKSYTEVFAIARPVIPRSGICHTAAPQPASPVPSDEQRTQEMRFWLSVLRVHNTIFPELNKNLRDNAGIGLAKFDVLAQLMRKPDGITMGELSRALKVSNGNVSGLVNRLIKDGLVSKSMSETDRRSFSVVLTEQGLATFHEALTFHQETLAEIMADVGKEVLGDATEPLRQIADRLKRQGQGQEDG